MRFTILFLIFGFFTVVLATPYVVNWEDSEPEVTTTRKPLLGEKKCTYGPAYWCHNITQAKQCGAMKHCIKKVWEPMVLPEDNDDVCQICKEMVKEARDQLLSNETQDELRQVLEGSCNLIPLKLIAKECSDFMDEFIPELIDALASRMDPGVVCAVSGLCNSIRIDEMLGEMKDIDSDGNTILRLGGKPQQQKPFDLSKDSCPKCTHFIGKAVGYFRGLGKEELMNKMMEVCGHLGSYSDSCRGIIMQERDNIYSHVQNEMNPQEMCGLVGLCNVVSIHPVKIETSASTVKVWTPPTAVNDDTQCDFCKQLVNYLRNWLTADTTRTEFQQVLDALCKQTGKYSQECLNLAKQYAGPIYQLLIDECDPANVCTMIDQCNQTVTGRVKLFGSSTNAAPIWTLLAVNPTTNDVAAERLVPGEKIVGQDEKNSHRPGFVYPMMELQPGERLTGDDESNAVGTNPELCKICTDVALEAQKYIRAHENVTVAELSKYVNKFCAIFMDPKPAQQCHQIVEKYGNAFVKTMINYLNPDFACTEIKVCPEPTVMVEQVPQPKVVKDIPTCSLCTFTVTKLVDLIGKNRSKEAIDSAVEEVCYIIPKRYESECLTFMREYGDRVIEMILIEGSAHEICAALHLCLFSTPTTRAPPTLIGQSLLPFDRYMPRTFVESAMTRLRETYPHIHTHLQSAINRYNRKNSNLTVKEKPTCAICEFVITQLDNTLGNNATEEEIKESVEHVCTYLPKTVQAECKQFVEQYGDLVISYLVQSLDPKQICINLNLCDPATDAVESTNVEYPMEVQQLDKCQLCILVSDYLSAFLDDPKVDISIEKLVEKVCRLVPQKYSDDCTQMIEDYGPYLLSLLAQETDKGNACIQVQLCPAA